MGLVGRLLGHRSASDVFAHIAELDSARAVSVQSQPPAPPQLSPDGKFWWNGQAWVPVGAAQQQQRSGRSGCWIVAGIIVAVLLTIGIISFAVSGGSGAGHNTSKTAISTDSQYRGTAIVGVVSDFDISVKNGGTTDIANVTILFDDGDRFLDHYTVLTSGPCTVDKSLPGLSCGPLAHGDELKFTMTAQPRDAGNFTFKFHIGDGKLWLDEADGKGYAYSWTQAIVS